MLVLFETPAGFALFKVLDEGKLSKVEDLWNEFATADSARKRASYRKFHLGSQSSAIFSLETTHQVSMISITLSTTDLNKNSPGPEACAAILWKTVKASPKAAEKLRITATELTRLQNADEIVPYNSRLEEKIQALEAEKLQSDERTKYFSGSVDSYTQGHINEAMDE